MLAGEPERERGREREKVTRLNLWIQDRRERMVGGGKKERVCRIQKKVPLSWSPPKMYFLGR